MSSNPGGDNNKREDNFQLIQQKIIHSSADLTCEPTQILFNWWNSFAPNFPSREDWDILNFPALAPHIYLIECISDGHYLYRLCGNDVGELIGNHYRMIDISVDSEKYDDRKLAEYLESIKNHKTANGCTGNLSFVDRDFINFESVDCPLMDEAGNLTHFIGVLCEVR